MKFIYMVFPLTILISLTTAVHAQSDPYARDLVVLTDWFEGEYDNDSQIWYEGRRDWGGEEDEKHHRLHAIHVKIDNENLGPNAFYVEEFLDDDTSDIVRQRIQIFQSDKEAGGIRMKIYFLNDAKKFYRQFHNEELLSAVTMDDLFRLETCDVIFKRTGEQYHGSMGAKECQFGEGDKKRYSVHDMVISKNQYWRLDQTFLVQDDSFYSGHPNDEMYKMRKAKYYSCDVSFHEKAYYMPSEKDKKHTGVRIHNQGGTGWFHNPITDKKYMVQLREKEYPFYAEGSDFFMLRFKEEGQLASDVIVTAEPGVKTLSFQMGWASAVCKMEE